MRYLILILMFLSSPAFLLTGSAFASSACDDAYDKFLELRKPLVDKAQSSYDKFINYYEKQKGTQWTPTTMLRSFELACEYRKAAVERDKALILLTPGALYVCLGIRDAPCDVACWLDQLKRDKEGEAKDCKDYEVRKKRFPKF